tara:strand:- start:526 stop:1041 length:516 start_codon:yes stop_codon:yes gene_type:complete
MPKGLKQTSSLITIGAEVEESAANTYTETRIDLQLNPLDNEVFVVQSIDLNLTPPDFDITGSSNVRGSLSTTSRTVIGGLKDSNVMAVGRDDIIVDAGNSDAGVAFSRMSGETPATALEYLGIIATNDFFLQVLGNGNKTAKFCSAKVYGYRARADAAIYAALVQSEVLTQ